MVGAIRDQTRKVVAEFNVWFDPADTSGIPTRIEFRARLFLRLSFEPEPGSTEAAMPWLIREERA